VRESGARSELVDLAKQNKQRNVKVKKNGSNIPSNGRAIDIFNQNQPSLDRNEYSEAYRRIERQLQNDPAYTGSLPEFPIINDLRESDQFERGSGIIDINQNLIKGSLRP
jgi:hypothetical protein